MSSMEWASSHCYFLVYISGLVGTYEKMACLLFLPYWVSHEESFPQETVNVSYNNAIDDNADDRGCYKNIFDGS